jgi:hypothetical protein
MSTISDSHLDDLRNQLLTLYGPLLGGRQLYVAMGFKTYSAFHRARQRGNLGVNVFSIEGRKGVFAFTNDVANWMYASAIASKT